MSITHALQSAKTGLLVNGRRAETTSANVANANTPGYVRRSLSLAENLLDGANAGVKSDGLVRATNPYLTETRRELASELAMAQTQSAAWQRLSTAFGNDSDGTGLFSAYQSLETALDRAANTPESSTFLRTAFDAAKDIVVEFADLSQTARSMRAEADREIAEGVSVVNAALKSIEKLNGRISALDQSSGRAAGLVDERERLLDQIAEFMPVKSVDRGNGNIDVMTNEGVFLLVGEAREVTFTPGQAFGPGASMESGHLSGLAVEGVDLTPAASSYAAISSGRFAALFTLRDSDAPSFTNRLDALATDLVERFSGDAVDPTLTAGEPGLFVDPGPSGEAGIAGRLQLNEAVDPDQGGELRRLRDGLGSAVAGPPGDGSVLRQLHETLTNARPVAANGFSGNYSGSAAVAQVASLTGQARIRNESIESSMQTQYGVASEAELSSTGVNVDAEMQELLLIEQAYAANARVVQTLGQMVDQLMQI